MKKHLIVFVAGLILILIGIICFNIETRNYNISTNLTSNFNMEQKVLEYEINKNETYRITNDGTNKNINLYIDNTLSNKVKIVVVYADLLKIDSDLDTNVYEDENVINVDIESELIIDFDDINDFYTLGMASLNNKTMYNYTLLKYPEIKVFVNEKYKNNIELVDKYGKAYNPIG